jgi:hypothetical protein
VEYIYIPRIGPHLFCSRIGIPILRIYKSFTDAWRCNSFSGNIRIFGIVSLQCWMARNSQLSSPRTSGIVRQCRLHIPSITYKITPCWVTILQPARQTAVLDQPSSLRRHWSHPYVNSIQLGHKVGSLFLSIFTENP